MLYPTPLHSFCFTFNTFSYYSSLSARLLSPSRQLMECAQGALKSGFGLEAAVKTVSQQVLVDEFRVVNGVQTAVTGDDFFVDDLLDFSNAFSEAEEQSQVEELEEKERDKKKNCSVSQGKLTEPDDCIATIEGAFHGKDDFGSLPCSEIILPAEGLESLEWLSHFVEDSFSEYPLTGKVIPLPAENQSQSAITVQENTCFTTLVQTKARTKRVRNGNRAWPVVSPSVTESSTSSSSSISSTTSFSPPNRLFAYPSQTAESLLGKPSAKKQKKKPTEASSGGVGQPRRCSHCGVTKTPQWRAGPLGSKTLCNACGVRFKSGRLLPEYRPACSPTFSNNLHSNNHRKVLEMRRKKEIESVGTGLSQPVQSF